MYTVSGYLFRSYLNHQIRQLEWEQAHTVRHL